MKVFIAVRLPGPTSDRAALADNVANAIQQAGHQPFVSYQEIIRHGLTNAKAFMPFVRKHIRDSGLVIILYDPDLRGGLIEEGIAYAEGIPIWLLHKVGERVSSSALGCAETTIQYENTDILIGKLTTHLANLADKGFYDDSRKTTLLEDGTKIN